MLCFTQHSFITHLFARVEQIPTFIAVSKVQSEINVNSQLCMKTEAAGGYNLSSG